MAKRDIIKRNLRAFRRAGGTLEQALGKVSPEGQPTLRTIWAELEGERQRKTPSYREGIEFIAMNDEPTNHTLDPDSGDYVGAMPTVILLGVLFGKEAHAVAEDVVAFRRKHA
jgi:hypothetical protein